MNQFPLYIFFIINIPQVETVSKYNIKFGVYLMVGYYIVGV